MKKTLTSYDILNIHPNASQSEVHAAYRRLAMAWHPDRQRPSQRETADKNFKMLQNAYNKIKTVENRRAYNQWLKTQTRQVLVKQNNVVNDNKPLKSLLDTLETVFWPLERKKDK